MKRSRWSAAGASLLAGSALWAGSGCTRRAEGASPSNAPVVLFVSADVRGYLEPCGCSENMRGGIDRVAYQVLEARKAGGQVIYADCGDSLFPRAKLTDAERPQEVKKAQVLAQAMKAMGLAHRTFGELDDASGAAFRTSLGLPEGADGTARIITASGHAVGLVSAQNASQLAQGAQKARAEGAQFVVGLVHDSFENALLYDANAVAGVDLMVASHAKTPIAGEESRLARAAIPTAQVQSKGRALLRLDLAFGGQGKFELLRSQADADRELGAMDERIALLKKQIDAPSRRLDVKKLYQDKLVELVQRRDRLAAAPLPSAPGKNTFGARFVPLEATMPVSPEVKVLVDTYDREVGQLNLAWAKEHGQDCPKPQKGEAGYVGSEACRDCHEQAFPMWEASKHAHAYESLEKAGKNYRVDCIKCHVVGYQQPGGVCRVDKLADRKDVGCEDCHGPGSIHAADPTRDNVMRKPPKESCVGCHDVENSPHFDFALFLPEILGPGHGKPAPDAGIEFPPRRKPTHK